MTHPDTPNTNEMKLANYPDVFADYPGRTCMNLLMEALVYQGSKNIANGTMSREALEADIHDNCTECMPNG